MNSLFQVSDESANLLSGVLVSLSGNSFRQNRITSENESLIFSNLVSLLSKLLSPAGVIFRGSAGNELPNLTQLFISREGWDAPDL